MIRTFQQLSSLQALLAVACVLGVQSICYGQATEVPLTAAFGSEEGLAGATPGNLINDTFTYDPNLPYFSPASVDIANIPDTIFSLDSAFVTITPTRFWRANVNLDPGETLDHIDIWGRTNPQTSVEDRRHQGLTLSFFTGPAGSGTLLGTSSIFNPSGHVPGVLGSAYGRFDVSKVLDASERGMVGSFRIDHADIPNVMPSFFVLQEVAAATGIPEIPVPFVSVNRDTGNVTINNGTTAQNLIGYSVTSDSGTFDTSAWDSITDGTNNSSLDSDSWTKVSAAITDGTTVSEVELPGGSSGIPFAAGASIDLGPIWQQHANEDITALLLFADGSTVVAPAVYEGNGQNPFPFGDLDFSNSVDLLDWAAFRTGFGGVYPNLTGGETYPIGDLDGDRDVDIDDFRAFEAVYNAANPVTLATALQSVPEPGTGLLLMLGSSIALLRRRSSSRKSNRSLGLSDCSGETTKSCPRANLFYTGILLGLSVGLLPNSVNAQSFSIIAPPANPAVDVTETSALRPDSDGEFLFDGSVTVADIDDADLGSILGFHPKGGFVFAPSDQGPTGVFIDNNTTITTNWIAFSQRVLPDDWIGKLEFWFSDTDFGGEVPTTAPDAVIDNLLDVESVTRFNSFSLDTTLTGRYAALNFIGAPGAIVFPGGRELRFLQGPDQFTLEVNAATGEMTIKNSNPLAQTLPINSYSISSDSGSLTSNGWTGLAGQTGFPAASAPNAGDGWEQGLGSGNNGMLLSEANLLGESDVTVGAELSIGTGYDTTVGAQDLNFTYTLDDGRLLIGAVEYIVPEADFDSDGNVDGFDFLRWQRGETPEMGSSGELAAWRAAYGSSSGSLAAVPEPGSAVLVFMGLLAVAVWHRPRLVSRHQLQPIPIQMSVKGKTMDVSTAWKRLLFCCCILLNCVFVSDVNAATPDRTYLLGDNSGLATENGASNLGQTVGFASGGVTLEHSGAAGVAATFTNLDVVGTPTYVDVGPAGLDRLGTSGVSVGISLNGTSDYVWSTDGFGNPVNGGFDYSTTFNYQGLINHYMQGWARPTTPGTPGQVQTLIRDTQQFRIFIQTDAEGNNYWAHLNSNNFGFTDVPVQFNEWTHVAQRHNGNDAVFYINGVIASVIDGYFVPNGGGMEGETVGGTSISLGADVTGGTPTPSNFFAGELDNFDIRVSGNNSDEPNGADYGPIDLAVDNAYIAALIAEGMLVDGDVNGDLVVNGDGTGDPASDDVAFFIDHYLEQQVIQDQLLFGDFVLGDLNSRTQMADLNFSGTTNLVDWFILLSNHEDAALAASLDLGALLVANSVPEPNSLFLIGASMIAFMSTSRRLR